MKLWTFIPFFSLKWLRAISDTKNDDKCKNTKRDKRINATQDEIEFERWK